MLRVITIEGRMTGRITYPKVRRDINFFEEIHGRKVFDPYRWLEQPDSDETKKFVDEQSKLTDSYLKQWSHRRKFEDSLTKLYDYEKFGCPFKRGDKYYQFYNSGLQSQSVLRSLKSLDSKPEIFFDPNKLTQDGTAALNTYSFSESGKYFAYGISYSGSDWVHIKVKNADTLENLSDELKWAKFTGISWLHDDSGFFYNKFPKPDVDDAGTETSPNFNSSLYFHKLGTSQEQDIMIIKDPENPTHMFGAEVSDDGKFLILSVVESCDPVNKLYILKLPEDGQLSSTPEFIKVVDDFKAEYSYITNNGSEFYFKTNLNAPRYRIVRYDLEKSNDGFAELLPQTNDVLESAQCINSNKLVTVHMQQVKNVVSLYDISTGNRIKQLPLEIGSIVSITGRKQDSEMYLKLTSFLNPGVIYRYQFIDDILSVHQKTQLNVENFNMDDYETKQVFYPSKDGTKIPMFITMSKQVSLDGENPTLLYGYGGFNVPLTPMFSPTWLAFIKYFGGIAAIANIRGGGEFGEDWHKSGSLLNKQNCFDDFQEAARYLSDNKYTSSAKLAINGGSNGGLLIGACVNQAPELFGCALADVGVMDMLRFHKFTIGHAWKSDFGDPEKKEHFEYILKYSPVHNVQTEKPYPPVLLLTSDHDDRVVPLHSYKYISELQYTNPRYPALIRIETKAGHGAGKPTKKRIEEATDRIAFLALSVGAEWKDY